MSAHISLPPDEPAHASCPSWCSGIHRADDDDDKHRIEVGRVCEPGTELASVVSVVAELPPGSPLMIELSWRGAEPGDTDHYFLEMLVLTPGEIAEFAELIEQARLLIAAEEAS